MTEPTNPLGRPRLRWRLWWRFAFMPLNRIVSRLPMAEWRKEHVVSLVDFWAMDHLA